MATSGRNSYLQSLDIAWQEHLKPRADDAPTVISTFAGCGGSSLGYSMAGFRELLAVEWDNNAVETFRLNFPDVPVYHGDIGKLSVEEALKRTGLKPGELDILDGSPPCQGFSTAGKRKMDDDRNQLFREYVRLLLGLKPKVFVMENVSGMVKGKMKLLFAEILRTLKASGYRVKARLLNAMYFGVPQSRQRMIFVGVREDVGIEPSYPKGSGSLSTVRAAIGHLPKGLPGRHEEHVIDAWRKSDRFIGSFQSCRLKPDKPSTTQIRAHRNWHYAVPRLLTNTESALIGSYHESFQWIGSKVDVGQRIGNSVPPLFMKAIAEHIRDNILTEPAHA